MSVTSPFAGAETAAGAVFGERLGVRMPERYGDPEGEYRAARQSVGLLDCSHRGLLALTGSERLRWLNGQITGDVKALRPGEGLLAAALNAKGRILADLAVFGLDEAVWVDLPRQRAAAVRETFEAHIIADDVAVEEAGDRLAHLALIGPQAGPFLAALLGALPALRPWHHTAIRIEGVAATLITGGRPALPGWELFVPAEAADSLWSALRGRGAAPIGSAALETLRLESGWPWYGVDFGEEHLLFEALGPEHVSFTKGCYLGQEVVVRIEHQGHLNKRLCGLTLDGTAVPPAGAPLYAGERQMGTLTSAVWSPALQRPIALGYVRRETWDPGTRLEVAWDGARHPATVTALPFVEAPAAG
jgi:folate-binding protein YgfZ